MVAGGSGRRFGGPKQFLQVAGRPVVEWSVSAARAVSDGVVLVVPAGGGSPAGPEAVGRPDAHHHGGDRSTAADRVVAGGASRAASVRCGLAAVPAEAAVIVVHDAVRPLATASLFSSVVDAVRAGRADGAIPVLPVTDTLKRTADGLVTRTEDRDGLVLVQTPQAFVAGTLRTAHRDAVDATDDAALLEGLGATVCTVPGDPCNLKLTRPEDLAVAEALLRAAR